jgi:hypothetical protein
MKLLGLPYVLARGQISTLLPRAAPVIIRAVEQKKFHTATNWKGEVQPESNQAPTQRVAMLAHCRLSPAPSLSLLGPLIEHTQIVVNPTPT